MTKLSDIQIVLLTTAATRTDGSLLPPPERYGSLGARIRKTIAGLIDRGLVEEKLVTAEAQSWRVDGERHFGVFISVAGRQTIGLPEEVPALPVPAADAKPASKIDMVVAMLCRDSGATLAELVEATNWQPHTTRAALTRLRQKGHAIGKGVRDDVAVYSLSAAS